MPELRGTLSHIINVLNGAKTFDYREFEIPFSDGAGRFWRVSKISTPPVNYQDSGPEAGEAVNNLMDEVRNGCG